MTDLPNRLAGWLVAGAAATVAALVLLPRRETPVDPPDAVTPPISVRLHDSVRTGVALGIAVLIADLASLKQGFWVALATLAVLRSTAFSTERRAVEAAVGTAIGFALSAALLAAVGVGRPALWVIVVVGSFLAADLPQLRGFLAGQAAFTVLVVALFNLSQPIGWRAGLVRIEDILIGAGVGLVVGLSLWPRARVSRS